MGFRSVISHWFVPCCCCRCCCCSRVGRGCICRCGCSRSSCISCGSCCCGSCSGGCCCVLGKLVVIRYIWLFGCVRLSVRNDWIVVCLFVFRIIFWKLFYVRNLFKLWWFVGLSRKRGGGGVIFVVNLLVVGL